MRPGVSHETLIQVAASVSSGDKAMKLRCYKNELVNYLNKFFPNRESMTAQIKTIYNREGAYNDFETYTAAILMMNVNRRTDFAFYDKVMGAVPDVTDKHFITLYRAAFVDYMGCTMTECATK